jgi:D-alanine-D-alanine ligase
MKINVAVFFGGKSVEHEISVISAIQAINYFDSDKYNVFPIYITKDNRFFYSPNYKDISNFRDLSAAEKLGVPVTFKSTKTHYGTPKAHLVPTSPTHKIKDYGIIDVALPITHGSNVEDGTISGLLELLNIPYAGSNVFSSALCMDKWASKLALQAAGIPVLPGVKLSNSRIMLSSANDSSHHGTSIDGTSLHLQALRNANISFPVIVKPVNLGSSVGISLATNESEFDDALELAFTFAKDVLVEPAVQNLRELNCSVLGFGEDISVSSIEEVFKQDDILSFDDKYLGSSGGGAKAGAKDGSAKFTLQAASSKSASGASTNNAGDNASHTKGGAKDGDAKSGMASLARKVPADVSDQMRSEVQDIAARAFKELRCHGVVRFDFLVDADTGKVYLNEVNTTPGSLAFYLWEASGVPYPRLLERLVDLAFKRARDLEDMLFSFETNVLANAAV